MYCYECAKNGKIHYVPTGYNECAYGHNIHVSLEKKLTISKMIDSIKFEKVF